jgi:hypothetical protein
MVQDAIKVDDGHVQSLWLFTAIKLAINIETGWLGKLRSAKGMPECLEQAFHEDIVFIPFKAC